MRRGGWSAMVGVLGAAGVIGLALFGMLGEVVAHLGDGGDPSFIHACVANRDGAVRIVGPTGSCNANKETAAHWAAGPSGRFVDLGLAIVDRQTGLTWEKKVTGSGCLHCASDAYNWCQATGGAGDNCSVSPPSWVAQVNAEAFAGFADWRVPSLSELQGIVDTGVAGCGAGSPCIDPIFGPTAAASYWSATEFDANVAHFVNFFDGAASINLKLTGRLVRAVRGP